MNIILYAYALVVFAVIDAIWLFSMGNNYKKWLGDLFAPTVNFTPAVIFYLIYAAGVTFFVLMPAVREGWSMTTIFLVGGALGFLAYSTYDLTNHATLKGWPLHVTLIDLAWGTLLTGAVSVIVVSLFKYFS